MMSPNNGVLNGIFSWFGVSAQPFLTSANQALICIVFIASWKGVSYWMMFLLAGLQGIPPELYEAAKIDGAGTLQQTIRITIPLLNRALIFVIVSDTVANCLMFTPMFVLTNGGPKMSTNVFMLEAYKAAFSFVDPGRANMMIAMLLLVIGTIVVLEMKFLRVEY
jgi:multiple sugar transport system permease protein